MKIQFLISSLSGGGAEKVLSILAKSFAQDENDVSILTLDKRPNFIKLMGVFRLSMQIIQSWGKFVKIGKIFSLLENMCVTMEKVLQFHS